MTKTRLNLASAPLLPVTVAFIFGILSARLSYAIWITIGLTAVSITLYFFKYRYLAIVTAAIATGIMVAFTGRPTSPPAGFFGHKLIISGVVKEMNEGDATRNLVVRVDSINYVPVRPFKVFTVCWNFHPEIAAADRITYVSELSEPDTGTDIPLELNYGEYLLNNGITATSFIKEGKDVIAVYSASGFFNDMIRFKERIVTFIAASRLSPSGKTFMITLLTGDKTYLTPDARQNFARAGVAHVLALSGLHVAIITIIISILLFPFTALRLNKLKGLITVGLLWFFAMITGLSPSVVRAVVMASVFLLGMLLERRPAPLNSLCFAALCILTADPLAVYSIGFQLSFAAVIFILAFSEKLIPFSKKQRIPYIA
ncbi:MAG: ComEC family competence protein, partial [Duncaniella sp.]|nr:ComEC family competence protein [Duncaniella sp.]